VEKNELLTLTTNGYSASGDGVARHEGRAVFVRRALSGETVKARVVKTSASAVFAQVERVLEPSPERITPACPNFGRCGGCDFLHMTYAEELRCKRMRVSDALRRIGGSNIEISGAVPSPMTERYRNKAVFEAGRALDGRAVTGFYRARSHEIVPCESCLIQSETSLRAAGAVREWMDAARVPEGFVRRVFVREGCGTQIAVVTSSAEPPRREWLVSSLRERVPETSGILQIAGSGAGNAALAGELRVLYGSPYLDDTLCGLTLKLSPRAFYQVNRPQAENLYGEVARLAALKKGDTAFDLYCGAGAIALVLAKYAGQVYGAEIVQDAVANARTNAALNGITNARFLSGDAGDAARRLELAGATPAVIAVDPPRKGLTPEIIAAIVRLAPRRVIYISCDPATLARDIKLFAKHAYAAAEAGAFDMFPRCAHIECCCSLVNTGRLG
jgi:23S rRNA (uracil1939-C5)-methyltransferase